MQERAEKIKEMQDQVDENGHVAPSPNEDVRPGSDNKIVVD